MAAEAARLAKHNDSYIRGSAAPAHTGYVEPETIPVEPPQIEERARAREKARAEAASRSVPAVSLFAVFGTVLVSLLMVLVVLAQINYNEVARGVVGLNAQYDALLEQQRKLEISFESVIDMKEVERYARDVLGMSKPEADQVAIVYNEQVDKVEILHGGGDNGSSRGFGDFISSLFEYFTG